MVWEKKGLIYKPSGEAPWMKSHAQTPTALLLDDRIRIYIAVRPEQSLTQITFIDVAIDDPANILYVHKEPILPLGKPGTFDEFGIMPNAVLHVGDEVWLYTAGWQRQQTVPTTAIGLAVSGDGGKTFTRAFEGPIMPPSHLEPYSTMGPCVMRRGDSWQMWYSTGHAWEKHEGKLERTYQIYYAQSDDGIHWQRPHINCIPPKSEDECSTRPAVIYADGMYHMWFSYRSWKDYRGGAGSYRMGYASSEDGLHWQRDDDAAGIDVSADGWDSEMIAYGSVIETPAGRYLFYNGNGFGESGFGYAQWREDE